MITAEGLKKVNESLQTVNIKGKEYVQVTERVKAFRQLCPEGSLTTEIVHFGDGMILMKATITDEDGRVLATGHAMEKEESSYINKTSYVENCETSAWGRALAAMNLGIDASMCSADELVNAISNQGKDDLATASEKKTFKALCDKYDQNPDDVLTKVGCKNHSKMTKDDYAKALVILKDIADSVNAE